MLDKIRLRMQQDVESGPIKDERELIRRSNVVLSDWLTQVESTIVEYMFDKGSDDHAETRQVLAETALHIADLKSWLTLDPYFRIQIDRNHEYVKDTLNE